MTSRLKKTALVIFVFVTVANSLALAQNSNELTASRDVRKSKGKTSAVVPKGLYLINHSAPNVNVNRTLHDFLLQDTTGRSILYKNTYGQGESVYFVVMKEAFPEQKLSHLKFVVPHGVFRKYVSSDRAQYLLDSLIASRGKLPTTVKNDTETTVIVLRESKAESNIRPAEEKKRNGEVQFERVTEALYLIRINRNLLRGGPRFRR